MRLPALLIASLVAWGAPAQAQDSILDKVINAPPPTALRVDGGIKGTVRSDPSVQGGKALRIAVPGKGANSWDVAVASANTKPVKAGDTLVVAFWARLAKGEDGATSATLPYNAVQLAEAPYTALFSKAVTIGPDWAMHEFTGKADKDYRAGALNVAIHLATGRQTIDLGPLFVLDMGQ